jgi:hypothetical protein
MPTDFLLSTRLEVQFFFILYLWTQSENCDGDRDGNLPCHKITQYHYYVYSYLTDKRRSDVVLRFY